MKREPVSPGQRRHRHTLEEVREVARKFETRSAFMRGAFAAYIWAWRNQVLDDVCAHMPKRQQKDQKR